MRGFYLPRLHQFGDLFHILPDFSLSFRIPQEKGGMVGGNYLDSFEIIQPSTKRCDLGVGLKQSLGGERP